MRDTGLRLEPAGAPRTVGEAQRRLAARFQAAGLDSPALDARLLVTAALGLPASDGIRHPELAIPSHAATTIESFAARRLAREPVSRILGRRAFYGLDLEIGPATLDPRPDTETLVEAALELVKSAPEGAKRASPRILDLGTGSGAIVIALLVALPEAHGVAVDIDPRALTVAARNGRRFGVEQRLQFFETSWFDGINGPFDLIVSNPPYIPQCQIPKLDPEVANFDPWGALAGGADGLDAYRSLIPAAAVQLTPGGWLALEIGMGQKDDISKIAMNCGMFTSETAVRQWPDLAGVTRCVAFQARPSASPKKSLDFQNNPDNV